MYRHITEADHLQKVKSFYADIIIATLKASLKQKELRGSWNYFWILGWWAEGWWGGYYRLECCCSECLEVAPISLNRCTPLPRTLRISVFTDFLNSTCEFYDGQFHSGSSSPTSKSVLWWNEIMIGVNILTPISKRTQGDVSTTQHFNFEQQTWSIGCLKTNRHIRLRIR